MPSPMLCTCTIIGQSLIISINGKSAMETFKMLLMILLMIVEVQDNLYKNKRLRVFLPEREAVTCRSDPAHFCYKAHTETRAGHFRFF